jgi:tRNA pseudouridine32 synthase/23S rRNA pseudouridine746 synthase
MYTLIYANDDFVVVSKPAFIGLHCDENITGFNANLFKQLNCQLFVFYLLDKIISGLMIFAKNVLAAAHVGQFFEVQAIARYYLAISGKKQNKK